KRAVIAIEKPRLGAAAVLERRKNAEAHYFIKALCSRSEFFQIVIVQGPHWGAVYNFPVRLVKRDIDCVGLAPVRELFAGEHNAVACESGFQFALRAIRAAV